MLTNSFIIKKKLQMSEIPAQVFQDNFQLQRILQPCVSALYRISRVGMACGPAGLERNVMVFKYYQAQRRMAELKQRLFGLAGYKFNVGYFQAKRDFLYKHLKLDTKLLREAKEESEKIVGEKFDDNKAELGSGAYEISFLHFINRHDPTLDLIFKTLIEIQKLGKVISTQYLKLMHVEVCGVCKGKTRKKGISKFECETCGGLGTGKVLGFDESFCSIRDGWLFVHSKYLQTQVTHRLSAKDFPITTTPRPNDTYKIYSREMFVAEPGYGFAFCDLAKAERRFAAVYYDDQQMLREVNVGQPAIAEYGMMAFGFTADQVRKGTEGYDLTKKTIYGGQYGMGGPRLHKMLIENYFYLSPSDCDEVIKKLYQRYPYQSKVILAAWDAFMRGYWQTYFGQRFIVNKPHSLMGYTSFSQIRNNRDAQGPFGAFARTYASTMVQGAATGVNTQIAILRVESMLKERKHLSKCKLCLAKHDELAIYGPAECLEECSQILDYCLAKRFETPQPYLDKVQRPDLVFGMQSESEITRQWHTHSGKQYENGEWRDGILYRA